MFMQPGGKNNVIQWYPVKTVTNGPKNLAIFFLKTYYSTSTERWLFICKNLH